MEKFLQKLIKSLGVLYSEELGIKLESKKEKEIFKWFLASILFGARIGETIAKNTYRVFVRHKTLTPREIKKTSWRKLIDFMGEGGYVRYDGKTSTKLLKVTEKLIRDYGGKLTTVHKKAKDSRDLEERLMEFYGVGPTTVNIFLRELRTVWQKADPETSPLANLAAKNLGIDLKKFSRKTKHFVRLECALLRLGKDWCRKGKCSECGFRKWCRKG